MKAPAECETWTYWWIVKWSGPQPLASIWVWSWNPLRFVRRHPPHHLSPAEQTTRQGAIPWGTSGHPSRYSNAPIEDESQSFLSKWSPEGPKSRLPYRGFESHSLRQHVIDITEII